MNKMLIIGNVGQTPEIKTIGESKVANFCVGVTERGYTKKDGTKTEDKTEWFNCQAWRGLAETIEKFVHKGDKLFVEGKMTSRKYTGNDGVERTAWEVNVSNIELLTPKGASKSPSSDSPIAQSPVAPAQAASPSPDDLPF